MRRALQDACIDPNGGPEVDNGLMSNAVWIVIAVLAVGTIAGGLVRMRAWLQKPAPPEVIDAAQRQRENEDD